MQTVLFSIVATYLRIYCCKENYHIIINTFQVKKTIHIVTQIDWFKGIGNVSWFELTSTVPLTIYIYFLST